MLLNNGTMSLDLAAYFWLAIEKGQIFYCCGGRFRKTTMLNALSLFVPSSIKLSRFEDTREINLPQKTGLRGQREQDLLRQKL